MNWIFESKFIKIIRKRAGVSVVEGMAALAVLGISVVSANQIISQFMKNRTDLERRESRVSLNEKISRLASDPGALFLSAVNGSSTMLQDCSLGDNGANACVAKGAGARTVYGFQLFSPESAVAMSGPVGSGVFFRAKDVNPCANTAPNLECPIEVQTTFEAFCLDDTDTCQQAFLLRINYAIITHATEQAGQITNLRTVRGSAIVQTQQMAMYKEQNFNLANPTSPTNLGCRPSEMLMGFDGNGNAFCQELSHLCPPNEVAMGIDRFGRPLADFSGTDPVGQFQSAVTEVKCVSMDPPVAGSLLVAFNEPVSPTVRNNWMSTNISCDLSQHEIMTDVIAPGVAVCSPISSCQQANVGGSDVTQNNFTVSYTSYTDDIGGIVADCVPWECPVGCYMADWNAANNCLCGGCLPVVPSCGAAAGVGASAPPTLNLCSSGVPSPVTGPTAGLYEWTCTGISCPSGSPVVACSAGAIVEPVCGAAHTTSTSTAPTAPDLCAAGTASIVDGMMSMNPAWTWTCTGINTPTVVNCEANGVSVVPQCNEDLWATSMAAAPDLATPMCWAGTPINVPPDGPALGGAPPRNRWTWDCVDAYGSNPSVACWVDESGPPPENCGTNPYNVTEYVMGPAVDKVACESGSFVASVTCTASCQPVNVVCNAATNHECLPAGYISDTHNIDVAGQNCMDLATPCACANWGFEKEVCPPLLYETNGIDGFATQAACNGVRAGETCGATGWQPMPGASGDCVCWDTPPATCPLELKSWTVGADTCEANFTPTTVGGSRGGTDSTGPVTGSASFTCGAGGVWAAAPNAGATCSPPPTLCWTHPAFMAPTFQSATYDCTMHASEGGACTVSGDTKNHGVCFNKLTSVMEVPINNTFYCMPYDPYDCWAPPPPAPCPAATLNWTVGANACSAGAGVTAVNGSALVSDAVGPLSGSATFQCSATGVWAATPDVGATCAPAGDCTINYVDGVAGVAVLSTGQYWIKPPTATVGVTSGDVRIAGRNTAGGLIEHYMCGYEGRWCHTGDDIRCDPWPVNPTVRCNSSNLAFASGFDNGAGCPSTLMGRELDCIVTTAPCPPYSGTCNAQALTWTVGGSTCNSDSDAPLSADLTNFISNDTGAPTTGTATFTCSGAFGWQEQPGATCTGPALPTGDCDLQWYPLPAGPTNDTSLTPGQTFIKVGRGFTYVGSSLVDEGAQYRCPACTGCDIFAHVAPAGPVESIPALSPGGTWDSTGFVVVCQGPTIEPAGGNILRCGPPALDPHCMHDSGIANPLFGQGRLNVGQERIDNGAWTRGGASCVGVDGASCDEIIFPATCNGHFAGDGTLDASIDICYRCRM